jgi:regulator of replication initiation timing
MRDPDSDTYRASRCLLDQIVALEENERKLLTEVERLRAQLGCTVGVGDGFVHGSHAAVKHVQQMIEQAAKLEAENAELQRQLDTCRRGFNNVVDMEIGTKQQLGKLEAENMELQRQIGLLRDEQDEDDPVSREVYDQALAEAERLRAENTELRRIHKL